MMNHSNEIFLIFVGGHTEEAATRAEVKSNVTNQWERKRKSYYLACLPIDAPKTAVLITVYSMNIHQYDFSHFLVLNVPSGLATS